MPDRLTAGRENLAQTHTKAVKWPEAWSDDSKKEARITQSGHEYASLCLK